MNKLVGLNDPYTAFSRVINFKFGDNGGKTRSSSRSITGWPELKLKEAAPKNIPLKLVFDDLEKT